MSAASRSADALRLDFAASILSGSFGEAALQLRTRPTGRCGPGQLPQHARQPPCAL